MSKDELYNLYYLDNMSISGIVRKTGISRKKINKLLIDYNIPKKTISEVINGIKHEYVHKLIRSEEDNKKIQDKRKKTNLERYGVENPSQSDKIKEKIKETNLERYGVENPFQADKIKEKIKKTNMERYGVENPMYCETFKDKMKQTHVERYGVENPGQLPDHADKLKKAWNNKTQNERDMIKAKRENTMMDKYGYTYLIKNMEHYNKMKQAMLLNYGVEHGFSSKKIQHSCFISNRSSNRYKDYVFPSGKIVKIMGYENLYLDYLLTHISEEYIMVGASSVPIIQYVDVNNNERRYYPDIYITYNNTLIEIKSNYTYFKEEDNNLLKQFYSKKAGYNHIIVILNANGDILNEIS